MSFRPSYYGGFPGPPANHYNQSRNQGQNRGFNPQPHVHSSVQDVAYFPDPAAPSFYPSSYHQPFNGNQMYPPEFGFASNAQYYPMHQPTEFYYEQSFSPDMPNSPPSNSSQNVAPNQYTYNPVQSSVPIQPDSKPPKPLSSHDSNSSASSGKSRRFSHQRNVKEAAASGTSGEVFTPQARVENKNHARVKKIQRKHSIRFSHQREMPPTKEESSAEFSPLSKEEDNAKSFEDSAVVSGKSNTSKESESKVLESKKKIVRIIPADNRNQATVLEDQLSYGSYECMVCCDRVRPQHAVWNCPNCFNLFHMGCIKKWARSPAAKYEESGWRCPGCQHVTKNVPNTYYCFCGKLKDPEYRRGELTPHSCGEMCGRKRKDNPDCTHACNILCHPGPCPQCPAMINKSCKCGKETSRVRCSQQRNLTCENECGKLLNCGIHRCNVVCHPGECKKCEEIVDQVCYCEKDSRKVTCGSSEHIKSFIDGENSYSCGKTCKKQLACGNHFCREVCHVGPCKSCSLLPSMVTKCPCTQTKLEDIKNEDGSIVVRESCLDPVPTCGKVCGKPLRCGGEDVHVCKLKCHTGVCPPCSDAVSNVVCRCGKSEKEIPCAEYVRMGHYICDRRCYKKKKCGKHKCRNTCCVDKQHECKQNCGRKLTCGSHYCTQRCHRGACHTCYNVSFDELRCHCGEQVLFPPIACGTKPPECNRECSRIHSCTHPVRHTCHSEASCPPCVELVRKPCNCGRVIRSNIMCHIENVSCGEKCGKTLPCGHKCLKICHNTPCVEEGDLCKQPCSIMRNECIHPCSQPCHSGQPCPTTPCKAMVTLKCACGRREQTVECAEGSAIVQSVNSAISSKESVDIQKLLRPGTTNLRTLQCDEECAVVARNKRLALALEIDTDNYGSNAKQKYSDFLVNMAKSDLAFIRTVEKELINLVEKVQWMSIAKQSHAFSPMKREKRQVIHELAEAFHCKSDSHDHEPKRNVVVTAEKNVCRQPTPLLSDAVMEKPVTSQRKVSPKPTRKGLLSSMKLVSYSSAQTDDVATKPATQRKQTPFTPGAPYKPPHRSSTAPLPSHFSNKVPSVGGALDKLSRKYGSLSLESGQNGSTSAKSPPGKKEAPPAKNIDYFDMTD